MNLFELVVNGNGPDASKEISAKGYFGISGSPTGLRISFKDTVWHGTQVSV